MRRLLTLGLLLLSPSLAVAQSSAEEDLASLREAVLHADYRAALRAAETFLAREDLSAAERNGGLEAKAIAELATRKRRQASRTLATLYSRDPEHRLSDPDASPVVQSAFARARERADEPVTPALGHDPPGLVPERRAPVLEVRIGEHADAVDEVRVSYRYRDGPFAQIVMTLDASYEATARLPLDDDPGAQVIQYFLEATAPSGALLAHMGTADEPLELSVPAAPPTPAVALLPSEGGQGDEVDDGGGVAKKWWFWTIIAVAVAGGVAGGVVAAGGVGDDLPSGSLGRSRLTGP